MLVTSVREGETQPAMMFSSSSGVILQRCAGLRLGSAATNSAVVGLAGVLVSTTIRENSFLGPVGIGNVPGNTDAGTVFAVQTAPLLTLGISIEDNWLLCSRRGVSFVGVSLHALETRIVGNFINDCIQGGIVATGFVLAGFSLEVVGNEVRAGGPGIVVGTSGARVTANSVSGNNQKTGGDAIVLTVGFDKTGVDQCHVTANRVTGVAGIISVEGVVKSAMIKNNFIDGAAFGGIVMGEKARRNSSVENNRVANMRRGPTMFDPRSSAFA